MARARGWGIPVPGDPDQVIYVWFDALANYITAPGYGTDDAGFRYWWTDADDLVHVIGKGIIRFHAIYWPAMLLSAGIRTYPTRSSFTSTSPRAARRSASRRGTPRIPAEIAASYGTDALRWWMIREVARAGDTDYTAERLVAAANQDLANNIGNLVNRTVSMVQRYRSGTIPDLAADNPDAAALRAARDGTQQVIDRALDTFDFRRAADAIVRLGDEGNRYIENVRPWELAKAERKSDDGSGELDSVLAELVVTCRDLAAHLEPFLPGLSQRIVRQCGSGGTAVAEPSPVFPRLEVAAG